ncbi:hypothetical protein [Hyalangium rubrum]|uniref:Uncharacterized protein n=1 Tax=Hyalangium rubrum TaxID=3103134 RepID=A0ABU5H032_9BACT|nr:hypothetical protein [Hyalangium sp. s54d21]MDY7226808.1 hypothetical protein [Hyalangium sp. s54d21]
MRTPKNPWSQELALLVFLLLVVPGIGLAAQELAPEAERIPGTETPASLRLVEVPREAEPVQRIHPVMRVTAEVGAMLVTSATMGVPGFFAGGAICEAFDLGNPGYFRCLNEALYGAAVGMVVGAPLGVWWGGKLARGKGTFMGALLGTGVAVAAGAINSVLITNDDLKPFPIPIFSLIGAVVGYELSHGANSAPRLASMASFQPVLAISGKSAALGLGGRF